MGASNAARSVIQRVLSVEGGDTARHRVRQAIHTAFTVRQLRSMTSRLRAEMRGQQRQIRADCCRGGMRCVARVHNVLGVKTFERSVDVHAPADRVWARVTSQDGINHELLPWLKMTMPQAARGLTIDTVPLNTVIGKSWILLFGVIPVDYDEPSIVALDAGRYFHEKSTMATMSLGTRENNRTSRRGPHAHHGPHHPRAASRSGSAAGSSHSPCLLRTPASAAHSILRQRLTYATRGMSGIRTGTACRAVLFDVPAAEPFLRHLHYVVSDRARPPRDR